MISQWHKQQAYEKMSTIGLWHHFNSKMQHLLHYFNSNKLMKNKSESLMVDRKKKNPVTISSHCPSATLIIRNNSYTNPVSLKMYFNMFLIYQPCSAKDCSLYVVYPSSKTVLSITSGSANLKTCGKTIINLCNYVNGIDDQIWL